MGTFQINLNKVKKNYEELVKELPNAVIAYALKANYDKRILKTLSELGCAAEVCSENEYELARKAGFKRIIINGFVVKPLKCYLQNVELIDQEVNGLRGVRMKLEEKSKVGVSENEIKGTWDCIAFHSSRAGISEWKLVLERALKLAERTGARMIDAGGGINKDRIELLKKIDKKLIIEPGRQLVEEACSLRTRVIAVKGSNVIIDTGISFFNKLSMSKYEVIALGRENEKKNKQYRVCGPVPTDLDNIGCYSLPELKAGDELLIKNCGAYTLSLSSDWVNKKPAITY